MESSATPYKLVFFDGDEEHEKGHVGLNSLITFKRFQALISQKLGFSQSRLCNIVFVCRRPSNINNSSNNLRRLPINEKTNFSIILNQYDPSREKDCYFLVSMKKSRRERKGRGKIGALPAGDVADEYGDFASGLGKKPERTILRRGGGRGFQMVKREVNTGGLSAPFGGGFEDGGWFRYGRIINSQSCYGNDIKEHYLQNFERQPRQQPRQRSACQLCRMTKERPVPFHLCVHDAVIRGTRGPSPAGPIQRPPSALLDVYPPFFF